MIRAPGCPVVVVPMWIPILKALRFEYWIYSVCKSSYSIFWRNPRRWDVSGWRWGYKCQAFGVRAVKWLWCVLICEVTNEIFVSVVIDELYVMFSLLVFAADSSVQMFTKVGFYCLLFMNILYMVGNRFMFPIKFESGLCCDCWW